jgi:peroxiredoxin
MRSTLVALALAILLPAVAPTPARAQDEQDDQSRVQALLDQAMDRMTAGNGLLMRAKTLQGADAERIQKEGVAAYEEAVAKYTQVLGIVEKTQSGAEELKAQVRGLCHYNIACARSLQGRKDEALAAFGQSLDDGFDDFDHIAQDTDLDPIRHEPRFVQLVERARASATDEGLAAARASLSPVPMFPYDFTVTTLDGKRIALADLRGKVVVVEFWRSNLPQARAEIPHFIDLTKEFGDKLVVIGMTWEDGAAGDAVVAQLQEFATKAGVDFPLTLVTDRAELRKVPDFRGFPTTLFIDKQGHVRAKEVGALDTTLIHGMIQALDSEPGTPTPAPAPTPAPPGGDLGPF